MINCMQDQFDIDGLIVIAILCHISRRPTSPVSSQAVPRRQIIGLSAA